MDAKELALWDGAVNALGDQLGATARDAFMRVPYDELVSFGIRRWGTRGKFRSPVMPMRSKSEIVDWMLNKLDEEA